MGSSTNVFEASMEERSLVVFDKSFSTLRYTSFLMTLSPFFGQRIQFPVKKDLDPENAMYENVSSS